MIESDIARLINICKNAPDPDKHLRRPRALAANIYGNVKDKMRVALAPISLFDVPDNVQKLIKIVSTIDAETTMDGILQLKHLALAKLTSKENIAQKLTKLIVVNKDINIIITQIISDICHNYVLGDYYMVRNVLETWHNTCEVFSKHYPKYIHELEYFREKIGNKYRENFEYEKDNWEYEEGEYEKDNWEYEEGECEKDNWEYEEGECEKDNWEYEEDNYEYEHKKIFKYNYNTFVNKYSTPPTPSPDVVAEVIRNPEAAALHIQRLEVAARQARNMCGGADICDLEGIHELDELANIMTNLRYPNYPEGWMILHHYFYEFKEGTHMECKLITHHDESRDYDIHASVCYLCGGIYIKDIYSSFGNSDNELHIPEISKCCCHADNQDPEVIRSLIPLIGSDTLYNYMYPKPIQRSNHLRF